MSSADSLVYAGIFPRIARRQPKLLIHDGQCQVSESLGLNLSYPLIGFADILIE
jgi:hypothetical protein